MKRLFLPSILLMSVIINACVTSGNATMSREDELRIGAEEHPKMVKEFGGAYTDAKLHGYINRIGQKLARHADASGLAYTFTILNNDKVNAFSLPGGYVYVTRGLLALAGNEAEIASVLAHEITHISARHTKKTYEKGDKSGEGFSSEFELEADTLGIRQMIRAGYPPSAMTSFFHRMAAHADLERILEGKKKPLPNYIHPRTAKRIKQATELTKMEVTTDGGAVRHQEYLNQIDGMVFGDDPEQGVRRGRVFAHPGLRIKFKVPPEFVLFNSPRQVVARGPNHSVVIFDMAPDKTARKVLSLRKYIAGTWAPNLELSGQERTDINGMEAAIAVARVSTSGGARDTRLVAIRGSEGQIFRLAFISKPEMTARLSTKFRRTTYSFRHITKAEADAIKPLRIKVVTVKPSDTVASLSEGFPFELHKQDWFRVLNGLGLDDEVKPGKLVKVIMPRKEEGGSSTTSPAVKTLQPKGSGTIEERLRKLKELYDEGLINADDYKIKKDALLDNL